MAIHQKLFPLDMSTLSAAVGYKTNVIEGKSGRESRNAFWQHPRRRYNAGFLIKTYADIETLNTFFKSVKGRLTGFLIQDYLDYQVSEWTTFAGTRTGSSEELQLIKTYTDAHDNIYSRTILFVDGDTVSLQEDGIDVDSGDFTVNETTGKVTYTATSGSIVKFKIGKFYIPVRFDIDELDLQLITLWLNDGENQGLMQPPDIPMVELRTETVSSTGDLLPTPPDMIPPSAISDLTYSSKTTYSITFTFTAPTDASGIGGYQYRIDGGTWTALSTTGTTTKTGTVTGLDDGVEYDIEVRSYDGASSPNYSDASNIITQTTTALTNISSLAYSSKNQSSITLTFTNPSETLAGFQYRVDAGSWTAFTPTGTTTKTFTVSGLSASTEYDIEVRSYDARPTTPNYSNASNTVTQTTDTPPPFWEVVGTGWIAQGDNDLEATTSNYTTTSRCAYDLTQEGDYVQYIEQSLGGVVVDNPNGNLLSLGVNDTIYSHAGGYGNPPGTTEGSYTSTPGNTMRWEIVNSGGLKIRLRNMTTATTEYTSSFTLDLSGGNRVEIRHTAYGDSIGTIFTKPVIVSGGVTY